MIQPIKDFIDRTTMYRLVLYYLVVLWVAALGYAALGWLSFSPLTLLGSTVVLLVAGMLANRVFAWGFDAVVNQESVYITAFILALTLPPEASLGLGGVGSFALSSVVAIASKFLLVYRKKHVFNPAAFAMVVSGLVLGVPATWWVGGNLPLLPLILVGGVMVTHKIRKSDLVTTFIVTALVAIGLTSTHFVSGVQAGVLHSVVFFFAFVMLTEPLTMPPTRGYRLVYAALVAILFIPAAHVGTFYLTPEIALLVGNLFSMLVSPKGRFMLSFVERRELAKGIFEYVFKSDRRIHFKSGQYVEWTLETKSVDTRGNRRFFTIASAPEDETVALGVRFYENPSAFKQRLAALAVGDVLSVSSLGGDFTMPNDTKRKLAFLAGGIGVTPFASMARHGVATGERRDAVLLYSSKSEAEVAYRDLFSRAEQVGWRTVYELSAIDAECIKREVPDYLDRLFYVSGPPMMVEAMKKHLIGLGVSRFNIKTDFFPGLA